MASRCLCERLLKNDFVKFRLTLVPSGARWTWLKLAEAMAVSDDPGTLTFGSPLGLVALVAALVTISETEAETNLETLVAVGLLRRTDNGVLHLPMLVGGNTKRAEAARRNGLLGGRPRRDGAPPRQREMMLPLAGGLAEKPNETEQATQRDAATTTSTTTKSVVPETQPDWVPFAEQVAEEAGVPDRGMKTLGVVKEWLAKGASEAQILELVRARCGSGRSDIISLRYFDKAIGEAVKHARAVPTPNYPAAEIPFRQQYREAVDRWQPCDGPAPKLETYLALARAAV